MNRENIKKVRDRLAGLKPKRFSMSSYFGVREGRHVEDSPALWDRGVTNATAAEGSCNSCACIAGHTMAVLRPDRPLPRDTLVSAKNLLGLTESKAKALFLPHDYDPGFREARMDLAGVTLPHAVRVLDHLLETGEVDWKTTRHPKKVGAAQ